MKVTDYYTVGAARGALAEALNCRSRRDLDLRERVAYRAALAWLLKYDPDCYTLPEDAEAQAKLRGGVA